MTRKDEVQKNCLWFKAETLEKILPFFATKDTFSLQNK